MSPLPLPIRLAAGLAAIAVERARKLPRDVSEWPMTAVSQALQVSMRVQQRITELAIKGDEALAALREPEEEPPWAVFDEDLPQTTYRRPDTTEPGSEEADELYGLAAEDAMTEEERNWFEAMDAAYAEPAAAEQAAPIPGPTEQAAVEPAATERAADRPEPGVPAPAAASTEMPDLRASTAQHAEGAEPVRLPNYRELSLASVRGRLRALSVADLEELLAYERDHDDRPEFVRMLTNRIATVRDL